jgi:hypothetical protein
MAPYNPPFEKGDSKLCFSEWVLKLHRGDGMTLIAMNWKNGQPPQEFCRLRDRVSGTRREPIPAEQIGRPTCPFDRPRRVITAAATTAPFPELPVKPQHCAAQKRQHDYRQNP